ncbi:serine hydrolase domain-containing protein [Kribbella sp. CA-293567]|uniref:serine hydrolase domain-containing protein n=1 Tax=Kribbella sp. CA-293567 TaxID=3002436 RepID=UPI0022DE34A1|nr:serine hydrolase domain-containing protein [Kribbella sp. CA-293567]WBQ04836.1 serine hydrolase [Kribbella sp. CA-293567]
MKRVLKILATAMVVVAVPGVANASSSAKPAQGELQQRLDQVVAAGSVGALAEVRTGDRVWRGTSGAAVLGTTRAVPVDGRYRIGSVTKTFVATVVLQLADERRLRLDDPVEKWLPGVVPNGQNITLRQLLNHTSGLYDYLYTIPFPPSQAFLANRWRTWNPEEQIRQALVHPPTSETPGTTYAYSNTGYLLLGQVIEKVTGKPYAKAIERRIIRPLKLRDTELPGTSPWIRGPHPRGYVPIEYADGVRLVDYTEMNPSVMGAGGEMISTNQDLNKFFAALLAGDLLPRHLLDEMKTPGTETKKYGLGLAWRDTECGVRVYGNDGDALAYNVWSFSTEDGRRQATLALTPNHDGDVDDAVKAFLDEAVCGHNDRK